MWSLYQLSVPILAVIAAASCSIVLGPLNVVGVHDKNVTLDCHSDRSRQVKWSFTPFGSTTAIDDQLQFPGRSSASVSNYGHHRLTLEGVTFKNAGRYVCRVEGSSSGSRDAAAAYVVVVTDPPQCKRGEDSEVTDGDRDSVRLECSVTFVSQVNLTLEWIDSYSGHVLLSRQFQSGDVVFIARLPIRVNSSSSMTSQYTCRAYFSNGTNEFTDVASNPPKFHPNICTVDPKSRIATPTAKLSAQPTSFSMHPLLIPASIIVVSVLVGLTVCMIIGILWRKEIRNKLQRCRQNANIGCSSDPENNANNKPLISRGNVNNKKSGDEKATDDESRNGRKVTDVHVADQDVGEQSIASDKSEVSQEAKATTAASQTHTVAVGIHKSDDAQDPDSAATNLLEDSQSAVKDTVSQQESNATPSLHPDNSGNDTQQVADSDTIEVDLELSRSQRSSREALAAAAANSPHGAPDEDLVG